MLWKCHECEAMNDNGEAGKDAICNSCNLDWHIWECPVCKRANAGDIEQETMCSSCGIVVYVDCDGIVYQNNYHIILGEMKTRTISHNEWTSNQVLFDDIETYLEASESEDE